MLKGKYFFYSCAENLNDNGITGIGNYAVYCPNGLFSLKCNGDVKLNQEAVISFQEINKEQYDKFHAEFPE